MCDDCASQRRERTRRSASSSPSSFVAPAECDRVFEIKHTLKPLSLLYGSPGRSGSTHCVKARLMLDEKDLWHIFVRFDTFLKVRHCIHVIWSARALVSSYAGSISIITSIVRDIGIVLYASIIEILIL